MTFFDLCLNSITFIQFVNNNFCHGDVPSGKNYYFLLKRYVNHVTISCVTLYYKGGLQSMSAEKHVFTEKAIIYGWQTVCTDHSRFCKEKAFDHAYFDGNDLVCNVMEEVSDQGAIYRLLAPTPMPTPMSVTKLQTYIAENNLIFQHEIVDSLHKGYSGEWISEFCKQHDLAGYLPYVFFKDGLLELHIGEFKNPAGRSEFIYLPH